MKEKFWLLILIVFFSLFQATIFSFNFVLLLILSLGVLRSAKSGFFWAFLAGVILDLVTGGTLGFSSLIFLLIIAILNLYKTKFKATNFAYLLPFTFFSAWFYELLIGEPIFWLNIVLTTALLFLIWPSLLFLVFQREESGLQLPLKL